MQDIQASSPLIVAPGCDKRFHHPRSSTSKGKNMNGFPYGTRRIHSSVRQRGMTLLEMMIVLVIAAALFAAAILGWNEYNRQRGANEGKIINAALTCAQGQITAPTFAGIGLAQIVNKDCFPRELVNGAGTATASATSPLAGVAYVVAPISVQTGTNNGIAITVGPISNRNCNGMVTQLDAVAAAIEIGAAAPAGATAPTTAATTAPKVPGSNINDDFAGRGCKSSDPVFVRATVGKT